jgi:hypothetical protein
MRRRYEQAASQRIGATAQIGSGAYLTWAPRDEPETDALGSRLRARPNGKLAQDRRHVMLDRPSRENEAVGDLGVREALAEEGEHLEFSSGEMGRVAAGRRPRPARKPAHAVLAEAADDDRGRGLGTRGS